MGAIFIFTLLAIICLAALIYPHIGAIGYLGFVILMPEWNWRWSLPQDFQYQKFIVAATLIGFVLNGLRGNPVTGPARNAFLCLAAFLGLAYVSAANSIDTFLSNFYMDILWKIVLMSFLTYRLVNTPGRLVACLWVITLAQGYNAFRINEQYFQDGISLYAHRPWGNVGDNNLYSNFTVPLIAMSGALVVYSRRWWQKCLAGVIFILQMHQIMLMESRGAMMGCLLLAVVFVYLMPKNTFTVGSLVIALVAGAGLAGPPVVREFTSSFKDEGERDSSADSRFKLWRAGARITMDHPLLGVGPYAGQRLVPRYAPEFAGERKGLHNLIFEISTGCGIPATLLYVAYFVIPMLLGFRFLWRRYTDIPDWAAATFLTAAAGLAGYWLSSMFSSGALMESSYVIAALGLSASVVLQRAWQEEYDDDDFDYDDEEPLPDDENLMAYAD